MSQNVTQRPESRPEQHNEPVDFDSRITSIRNQIADLQRELHQLEERQHGLNPQETLQTPGILSAPVGGQFVQGYWKLLVAIIVSLVLVYSGQFVLLKITRGSPEEGLRQALAGGLLIGGALLFGVFAPRVSNFLPRLEFHAEVSNFRTYVWRNRWTLGWLSAAVALATIALIIFATVGESSTLILIWLVSIVALFISQMQGVRISRPRIPPEERIYLVGLTGLLLIALITRIYNLTTLPYNFDGDFASVGLQARALLTGEQKQIFAYGWAAIPMLGYLPSWLSMGLFGNNLAGLNAAGVIEGMLIIVCVYLLGRDLFHARIGLIAAALMTISYAHLAASRQCVYLDPVVFLVFGLYFLFIGLREGRGSAIVTSGLLTAFCALVYYPSRIIVFIAGFMLLYLLLFRRRWLWAHWWTILLWVLAVLITLGPMLVVFLRDFNGFMSRTREVFILTPDLIRHAKGVYQVDTIPEILLEQARRSVLLFHYYNDTGTQFGFRRPLLDPFMAPMFTLGMGYALFQLRRFGPTLLLAWIVLGVVVGTFLTGNPPFWARLMLLLPPATLLAAVALNVLYELINRNLGLIGNWGRQIAPAALILCLFVVGVFNWNTYVDLKGTYANARTRIARYLDDQPDIARAYLVSTNFGYRDREFDFLVPGRLVASLTPDQIGAEIQPVGTPTLLIVTTEHSLEVQRLQQLFPNGSTETQTGNSPNEIAFYVFRLP
jgi:4-amino-4-deoxy-L-arabinose transferase-like glycosyltransferase